MYNITHIIPILSNAVYFHRFKNSDTHMINFLACVWCPTFTLFNFKIHLLPTTMYK